ncbi:MAG: hypothetical protein WA440_03380 [Ignavibacteriaceae bacterium]
MLEFIIIILIIGYPVFIFISKNWITSKINNSLKHHYDKLTEDYKRDQLIKQKSELIGDLLSEWISHPEDQKKLNQLTFEAFLWLPKEIANDLSDTLSHKNNAKSIREIISAVRIHLLGEENRIEDHKVIVFTQQSKIKQLERLAKQNLDNNQ